MIKVLAVIGAVVAISVGWGFVKMLYYFVQHMRVVQSVNLTNDQGTTLAKLACWMESQAGKRMSYQERWDLGFMVAYMPEELVAGVNNRSVSEATALHIMHQAAAQAKGENNRTSRLGLDGMAKALGAEANGSNQLDSIRIAGNVSANIVKGAMRLLELDPHHTDSKTRIVVNLVAFSVADAVCQCAGIDEWEYVPVAVHLQVWPPLPQSGSDADKMGKKVGRELRVVGALFNGMSRQSDAFKFLRLAGQAVHGLNSCTRTVDGCVADVAAAITALVAEFSSKEDISNV